MHLATFLRVSASIAIGFIGVMLGISLPEGYGIPAALLCGLMGAYVAADKG